MGKKIIILYSMILLNPFHSIINLANCDNRKITECVEKLSCKDDSNSLIQLLYDKDITKRRKAVKSLGYLKCTDSVSDLMNAIKDADWMVRAYAAFALGEIKDPKSIDGLINLLNDDKEIVELSSAEALGKMQEKCTESDLKNAEDKLIEILKNNRDKKYVSPFIKTVVEAMGYVKGERSVPNIIDVLESKRYEYNDIHIAALETLGEIGNFEAIQYIKKYVFEKKQDHLLFSRIKGIEILGKVSKSDVIVELINFKKKSDCRILIDAIHKSIRKIKMRIKTETL